MYSQLTILDYFYIFNYATFSIPMGFCAVTACNALALICIGLPSGLITVTVLPKINLGSII